VVKAGECWLKAAESWGAGLCPSLMMPKPGGWLDARLRGWCGLKQ